MIIAADIGGTSTRLALADQSGEVKAQRDYASRAHDSLEAILRRFLADHDLDPAKVSRLVLALAAPLTGDCVKLTNLPWELCRDSLRRIFPGAGVDFINDFQAAALGALAADEDGLLVIQDRPRDPEGRRLALGAGTGMGVAYLHPAHGGFHPWPTEAGHMSFAPASEGEWRLLRHLQKRFGRVSWERVLSGPGLANLYGFLSGGEASPEPPAIIDAANAGSDPLAVEALELFSALYGRYCGDLALAWQPCGGIYLLGGVTTHITGWLRRPPFLEAYGDKGRMSALVNRYPIHVVMTPGAGLLGAIRHALQTQVKS